MTIEAIANLVGGDRPAIDALARGDAADSSGALYRALIDNLDQVNASLVEGQAAVQDLALGNVDNLHQLVMNAERTRLQFDLLMSVRNRVLEAYQEILRMQV